MAEPLDIEENERVIAYLKKEHLSGEEARLKTNIGNFVMWFGCAEMYLTRILAYVLDYDDMDKFNLLSKGMDARVKCERFRKATKRFMPAGPTLLADLSRFERKSIPLRNKIAHSWPGLHDDTIYFGSVGYAPTPDMAPKDGSEMSYRDLFLEGMWLCAFTNRLSHAWDSALHGGPPEVVEESPNPPPEAHHESPRTGDPARSDKPPQNK